LKIGLVNYAPIHLLTLLITACSLPVHAQSPVLTEGFKRTDSNGDPEACERYLNHVTLEAQLERGFGGGAHGVVPGLPTRWSQASSAMTQRKLIPFPMWMRYSAAAVLAVCVTWLAMNSRGPSARPAGTTTSATWLATVLLAEDCEWAQARPLREGERVAAGVLRRTRELAVLCFDGGAELVLRVGTELERQSAGQARLVGGEVTIRATDGVEGFRLLTPAGEVVDLGTEFAVKVERTGATEVHVIEGEVSYRKPAAAGPATVLGAGHAVRFDRPDAVTPRAVPMNEPKFEQIVQRANPRERADLMTVYEGFHYDEGSYAPGEITKGKGWAGPWRLRGPGEQLNPNENDSTTDMRIVHGRLTVPWPVPGGRLGMLEMPAGRTFRVRPMAEPIAMDRDGITYLSMMTQEPDHSSRRRDDRPQEGVRLTFRGGADYRGESLSFGLDVNQRPHIRAQAQGSFASLGTVPDEQSLLWIGKIIRRADGEDEISLRLYGQNDALDYAEPAAWHVATRNVRMKAALDLVVLSSTGAAPRIVDEPRIGPSWRSVVPIRNLSASVK
jgi:hypothetical protein